MIQSKEHDLIWIGVGAFAGLIGLGAGGVRSHLVVRGLQQTGASPGTDAPRQVAPVANGLVVAAGEPVANLSSSR